MNETCEIILIRVSSLILSSILNISCGRILFQSTLEIELDESFVEVKFVRDLETLSGHFHFLGNNKSFHVLIIIS